LLRQQIDLFHVPGPPSGRNKSDRGYTIIMIHLTGHSGTVRSVAYSPDGTTLASGSEDGTVRLWDLATRKAVKVHKAGDSSVESVTFAPDGKAVAAGCADGSIKLWWPVNRRETKAHSFRSHESVRAVLFVPEDGRTLASAGWEGAVRLWDVTRGTLREFFPGTGPPVTALACPRDGSWFALGLYDGKTQLWTPRDGKRATLDAHDRGVFAAAVSPDGATLATADGGGTVKLWDVAARKERASWQAHDRVVYGLAFTPDGAALVTGGADGTVKVWDPGGRPRAAFQWQQRWVTSLAIAPDGMTAAAGGADQTVVVWDIDVNSV
jgi:WD40 repeat protein